MRSRARSAAAVSRRRRPKPEVVAATNVELVREMHEAFNRGDFEAAGLPRR
jgi:hypothetical protein